MKIDKAYKERKRMAEALNRATKAYDEGHPIINDKEWDDMFFELTGLEESAGMASADSPTQTISYTIVNELEKIKHEHPMLSLPKTKSIKELEEFVNDYDCIVMPKLDGLTCSLTYENGKLVRAETRGDGHVGENILHNAQVIHNIPNFIDYKERLVVDGEIICTYNDFELFSKDYKNPRNFAAGSIRLLDSRECAKRNLTFIVWDVIEGFEEKDYLHDKLELAYQYNFITVDYTTNWKELQKCIDFIVETAKNNNYPIDGIVIKYESKKLRQSLPGTSHHLGGAIAYKFYEEEYPTQLKNIEWTMGRTGVLTPIAIFDPIDIDGSTVERASLHNLTVMKETLGTEYPSIGDIVYVYKSNEIIPQISKLEKNSSIIETIPHPNVCPICGNPLKRIKSDVSDTENLVCINSNCDGKLVNKLDHYCSKKGLDIKGLSKKTLEKLINWGWVDKISDIYYVGNLAYEDWIKQPGFGKVSVDKILKSIKDNSTDVKLEKFISAIGIPMIGMSTSQEIVKHIKDWEEFREKINNKYDFTKYENIGLELSNNILNFDYTEADYIVNNNLVNFISPISTEEKQTDLPQTLKDKVICITGKLQTYKNREELAKDIVNHGGKIIGSVSTNCDILINNDINSTSSKNKTAKKLNIPVMSELEFKQKYLT